MLNILKTVIVLGLSVSILVAANKQNVLKNEGVIIEYQNSDYEMEKIAIKRIHDDKCKDVKGMNPDVIWGGDYAKSNVPAECKKTYVTTVGKLSPVKIAEGIDTYGELEVIEFIKKAQKDESMILVDARMANWYQKGTIPTAINMSFKAFNPKHADFEIVLDTAGVEYDEDTKVYDFTEAKTMVLFCNGIWCPQSTWAIENLIKLGYPKDKLKWYRGGMYSWTSVNLTTIVP